MVARGSGAKVVSIGEAKRGRRRERKSKKHEVRLVFDSRSFETMREILEQSGDGSYTDMILKSIIIYGRLVELFSHDNTKGVGNISELNHEGPIMDKVMKALEINSWLKQAMRKRGFDKIVLMNSKTGEAIEAEIDF